MQYIFIISTIDQWGITKLPYGRLIEARLREEWGGRSMCLSSYSSSVLWHAFSTKRPQPQKDRKANKEKEQKQKRNTNSNNQKNKASKPSEKEMKWSNRGSWTSAAFGWYFLQQCITLFQQFLRNRRITLKLYFLWGKLECQRYNCCSKISKRRERSTNSS